MDPCDCSCNHEEESYFFLLFDSFVKLGNLFGLIYFLVQWNAVDKMLYYLRNESNDNWVNITQYKNFNNSESDNSSDNKSDKESDNNSNSSNDIIDH